MIDYECLQQAGFLHHTLVAVVTVEVCDYLQYEQLCIIVIKTIWDPRWTCWYVMGLQANIRSVKIARLVSWRDYQPLLLNNLWGILGGLVDWSWICAHIHDLNNHVNRCILGLKNCSTLFFEGIFTSIFAFQLGMKIEQSKWTHYFWWRVWFSLGNHLMHWNITRRIHVLLWSVLSLPGIEECHSFSS